MDKKAMYKLTYGLFVLTANENGKDNGCIINTAIQAAGDPNQVSISVSKQNYTHDMIVRTGKFTVSSITEKADFSLFKRFGFQSGKDTDKFQFEEALTNNGYASYDELQKRINKIMSKINTNIPNKEKDIDIEKTGKDILIGFNPKFFIDALRVIDEEEVSLYMVNPKAPCFIRDDDNQFIYLILPVNFNNV